jgi:hypothetical protein
VQDDCPSPYKASRLDEDNSNDDDGDDFHDFRRPRHDGNGAVRKTEEGVDPIEESG